MAEPAHIASTYNGDDGERYIACYPYQSAEAGDLVFDAGEEVMVVKKDGDWWTGVIGNRTGIFPANYVHLPDDSAPAVTNGNVEHPPSTVMSAEEARNQADADSEVSQINTQNVSNDAGMQEFRGMTASAVSSLLRVLVSDYLKNILLRVCEQRKERLLHALLLTKQQAASNCLYRRVSWL